MYLLKQEGNIVVPTIYALTHPLYKVIWERDLSEKKSRAILDFTYIEYMKSPRKSNVFSEYEEGTTRHEKIVARLFPAELNWQPDDAIIKCMDDYETMLHEASRTYRHYKAAASAMDKLSDFLNTVDPEELTNAGNLRIKPTELSNAIAKSEASIKALENLKHKIDTEVFEDTKTRANRKINFYETPENVNIKKVVNYE